MPTRHRVRWSLAAVAALATAGALVWTLSTAPVEVETALVTRGDFEKTVDEDGKTRVRERYVISAPLAGRLLRVELKPGAEIAPGALVATLVPASPVLLDARTGQELSERVGVAEAAEKRAEAGTERARVALKLANSELARSRELATQGFVSKQAQERIERDVELKEKELTVAEFDAHAAAHQRALAHAALSRARGAPANAGERWDIRSPVPGRVLRVAQENEAVVAVGAPIIELGDPRSLEVVVDVLTADAPLIRPGAAARLDPGDGGPAIDSRVRLVEPSAFTKVSALGVEEQRVNVVIDLVAPRDAWPRLGDGYRVDARIVVDRQPGAVTVPLGALFKQRGEWRVYAVEDGRARARVVEIGARSATDAVVLRGVAADDRVIVYPANSIEDGTRVRARAGR
jgi:HlyD family secretion protein